MLSDVQMVKITSDKKHVLAIGYAFGMTKPAKRHEMKCRPADLDILPDFFQGV